MVKCPNCGSTAQVKLMFADDLDEKDTANLNWIYQYFHCGCGCDFKVTWIQEGVFKGW